MAPKLRTLGFKIRPSPRMKVRPAAKVAAPFYLSRDWRDLVAHIIAQRGAVCEDPAHDPSRAREGVRIFGDHIQELRDGGAAFDPQNIMLRCASCHSKKTAAMRAARYHAAR
jgi:5-methylcytosine-specific restriction enzyme A